MPGTAQFIFDFDSTFTSTEALDVLAGLVLTGSDKEKKTKEIAAITELGMAGKLSFRESLKQRMELLTCTRTQLYSLVEILKKNVSKSIKANRHFFLEHQHQIYIVSSGFKDFIVPVVAEYGISSRQVFANNFTWKNNNITGFDPHNPLSMDGGKPLLVKQLQLPKPVVVIGDGYTDYEIKKAGYADYFVAYTENIHRPSVTKYADCVAANFNDFLNFISNEKVILPQKQD